MAELMNVAGRKFGSAAHALAMGSMAKAINNAPRPIRKQVDKQMDWTELLPHLPEHERNELLAKKALTRDQQYIVSGILELIKEIDVLVGQINTQSGAWGCGLPILKLYDLANFNEVVYRRCVDAMLSAEKTGQELILGNLEAAREMRNFKRLVVTLDDKRGNKNGN